MMSWTGMIVSPTTSAAVVTVAAWTIFRSASVIGASVVEVLLDVNETVVVVLETEVVVLDTEVVVLLIVNVKLGVVIETVAVVDETVVVAVVVNLGDVTGPSLGSSVWTSSVLVVDVVNDDVVPLVLVDSVDTSNSPRASNATSSMHSLSKM